MKNKITEILKVTHVSATKHLWQKDTVVEILEWDFILDEKLNIFVLGCSRCPDLTSGKSVTTNMLHEFSVLLNDSDFFKFISGDCLKVVDEEKSKFKVLINEWSQQNRKHIDDER